MRAKLIPIGNSQGIRIPKPLIDQVGLYGDLEMTVESGALVVRRAHGVREGWDAAYAEMAKRGDDRLIDGDMLAGTAWDDEEWEWS